ncbi:hypothetical protein C1645_832485 [Glomus cerebriforme]|uniref:Protein kinase domain-containing protein n=1 Tax=Glomus cerebriforme TaxID=658196 RepID=A0A397SJY1_9GLOM|nr:hypothetical protein C1645_832485 [Glomus cerebriforme]
MTSIRSELVIAALNRAFVLIDYNIHNILEKRYEFRKQIILADESLTDDEKSETIKLLNIILIIIKFKLSNGNIRLIDGPYYRWDNQEKRLKRFGKQKVILKKLKNIESANRNWFEEGKSHLTMVQCFGLTKDPLDRSFMLMMRQMDMDLRKYLQQNNHKITWNERIDIVFHIVNALSRIHNENAIR